MVELLQNPPFKMLVIFFAMLINVMTMNFIIKSQILNVSPYVSKMKSMWHRYFAIYDCFLFTLITILTRDVSWILLMLVIRLFTHQVILNKFVGTHPTHLGSGYIDNLFKKIFWRPKQLIPFIPNQWLVVLVKILLIIFAYIYVRYK